MSSTFSKLAGSEGPPSSGSPSGSSISEASGDFSVSEDSLLLQLVRAGRIPSALQAGEVVTGDELRRSMDLLHSHPFTSDAPTRGDRFSVLPGSG